MTAIDAITVQGANQGAITLVEKGLEAMGNVPTYVESQTLTAVVVFAVIGGLIAYVARRVKRLG